MSAWALMSFGKPSPHLFNFSPQRLTAIRTPYISWPVAIKSNTFIATSYQNTMYIEFPITVVVVYVAAVLSLNKMNRIRNNKPWAITMLPGFNLILFAHNLALMIFSSWVFINTYSLIKEVWPREWQYDTLSHSMLMLCKVDGSEINRGPRPLNHFSLWDKGISFLSWTFYLSKYYELLDTVILLIKGKECSPLQLFHHAGMVLATWAAVRYVASPELIGLVFNSGIHCLMYSYYALTSIHLPVPRFLKRALTCLQISQFVVGWLIACCYLAIKFRIYVPDAVDASLRNASTDSIRSEKPEIGSFAIDCLDNSGQALALALGTLYLFPLTYLFVRFFMVTYMQHSKQ